MGYILPECYELLAKNANIELPKILIETGTFKGGLAHRYLETNTQIPFKKIYTFELGESISKIASKRFKLYEQFKGDFTKFNFHTDEEDYEFDKKESYLNESINLINSDSVTGLKKLLPTINETCCFWLDAHAGAAKYARGPKDVPLLDELQVISEHHIKNHIIAVDDAHLFGTYQVDKLTQNKVCDYTGINESSIVEQIKKINANYTVGYIEPYKHLMLVAY